MFYKPEVNAFPPWVGDSLLKMYGKLVGGALSGLLGILWENRWKSGSWQVAVILDVDRWQGENKHSRRENGHGSPSNAPVLTWDKNSAAAVGISHH